jgi:hypothetical protein
MVDESTKYSQSIFSCHMSSTSLHIEYVFDFGVWGHANPICWGDLIQPHFSWVQKSFNATHHRNYRWVVIFFSIANPCGDGLSSPSLPTSPQSHTPMYTTERLFGGKSNMMLSCDKSLCNVLNYWTTFMMHKYAQANLTHVCLNVMKH